MFISLKMIALLAEKLYMNYRNIGYTYKITN